MTALLTELRLAIRTLLKSRGFTAAAVVTLGLGMTLSTIAMVAVNAYMLTGLPYPAADRLYQIQYATPGQDAPRGMESLDWRSLDDVIEHPVAWDLDMFYLVDGEQAESAPGAWVTRGFVEALGIQPAFGRPFEDAAFATGGENVAIISHRLWTNRFGSDPGVVGRKFTAYVSDRPGESERYTIVGVMPQRFWHLNPYTDILVPLRAPTYPYMARLRPGVTAATAVSRITALVTAGASRVPENWAARVAPAHDAHIAQVRPSLRVATTAAALVLLVACANVAGLLLVRSTRRQREIAVRAALGAGRAAIARTLLAEALVISAAATSLALLITQGVVQSLAPLVQLQLGRSAPGGVLAFELDWRVLLFAASVGLITSAICTLVPFATSLRPQLLTALQAGSHGSTEGSRSRRIRTGLMVMELAASLALLAGSAVMLRSVVELLGTDLGFSADRVVSASLTLRQNRYPDAAARVAVFDRIAQRLAMVPGVEAVATGSNWPLQQPRTIPVQPLDNPSQTLRVGVHVVSESYFDTLAMPLVAGRPFTTSANTSTEPIAIVSASLAERIGPSGNAAAAIGTRVAVPERTEGGDPLSVHRRIVGVVRDVRQGPTDTDYTDLYVPARQSPARFGFFLVRTAGAPEGTIPAVRAAFREVDPEFVVDRARPLQAIVAEATARPRFMASLLTSFAGVAALLALVGVYSVIAYAVRQREREIAVRLAVGADPGQVVRLFLRQGARILAVGLSAGVVLALAAGKLIENQLFGVRAHDPLSIAIAVAAFGCAGLVAVWWPARRAAVTDPAITLRAQ